MTLWQQRGDGEITEPPYPMPSLIWQTLYARGLRTTEAINNFLSPKLKDLKNPFELLDLKKSVDRIIDAFSKNEKIAIYADFDLDGTSGLALLVDGFKRLGFGEVLYYQPKRLSDGYGLHASAVEELAQKDVKVIVSVDVGITAFEAALRAKECKVDLIITDHHLPAESLPEAFAIVNPNRKDCTSGLGYLCGAGVAFFLLLGLKTEMSRLGLLKTDFNLKEVLDYFIIGTLTDMVPLTNENRVLVKHGLLKISHTQRPGLKILMEELGMWNRPLTSQDIAIGFAPKLNALSRIESTLLPRDVLLVENENDARVMVKEVLKTQELRKKYQSFALEKAMELKEMMDQKGYVWLWSQHFHKGVIGLVATQFVQRFGVPCFIGSINDQGKVSGSARAPDDSPYDLTKILNFSADVLEKHGGHAHAAGFQLDLACAASFDTKLNEFFEANPVVQGQPVLPYDAVGEIGEITGTFMKWFDAMEPFGKDFPTVNILFKNVYVYKKKELSGGHLKYTFKQDQVTISGLIFSPKENIVQEFDIVDVVAQPQWNYFNGNKEIQLLIRDIRKITT